MSGIVGLYFLDGQTADAEDLDRMINSLVHRGGDDQGVWKAGPIGLGHCMLWTTPESLHEKLPFDHDELVITADARIDNREALNSTLGIKSEEPEKISDSMVILQAYRRWGQGCVEHLLGDFAFAIWDSQNSQLFCARDTIGVRPFYYYHGEHFFAFASEIKALLALPLIPQRLNESKVADFLFPLVNDLRSTPYRDINKLEPAHSLLIERDNSQKLRRYWQFDANQEVKYSSDEEYEEAFRMHFMEAVQCRLRSAYPVGSTLSGGLDSSSIACTAEHLLSQSDDKGPLHTFSAIFPSIAARYPQIDERPYMEAVLAKGRFEGHFVRADQSKPLADVLWDADEPLGAPSTYMGRAMFNEAQSLGVRVLLSGFGGDSIVSHGFEYLFELAKAGRWRTFAQEAEALAKQREKAKVKGYFREYGALYLRALARDHQWKAFNKQSKDVASNLGISRKKIYLNYGLKPVWSKAMSRWQKTSESTHRGLNRAIRDDFVSRSGVLDRFECQAKLTDESTFSLREQLGHTLSDGIFELVVNISDKMGMRYSLEQRYPFFDRRLIDFCMGIPFDQKLKGGWPRSLFRRAMQGILPPEIQWRNSKGDLSSNGRLLLLSERNMLDEIIMTNPEIIAPYVDIDLLRESYKRFLSEPVHSSDEDLFTVFLSVNLAFWLQQSVFGKDLEILDN